MILKKTLCQWFSGNQIKGNTEKCPPLHYAASNISLTVENKKTKYIVKNELLNVTFH